MQNCFQGGVEYVLFNLTKILLVGSSLGVGKVVRNTASHPFLLNISKTENDQYDDEEAVKVVYIEYELKLSCML